MNRSVYLTPPTFTVLITGLIATYLSLTFRIQLDLNLTLFGLAIAFPMATSIQTAFKRRERAIEYLSLYKAAMAVIYYSFQSSGKLDAQAKAKGKQLLAQATDDLLTSLKTNAEDGFGQADAKFESVMQFMEDNRAFISARLRTRVIRYVKDAEDSAAYLLSLTKHRTMAGLRLFALVFTHAFAILNAPALIHNLQHVLPEWGLYASSALSSLILISLYNFQSAIEYPFDQKGADDIKLDYYRFNP